MQFSKKSIPLVYIDRNHQYLPTDDNDFAKLDKRSHLKG